jgi:hypothetical protein
MPMVHALQWAILPEVWPQYFLITLPTIQVLFFQVRRVFDF